MFYEFPVNLAIAGVGGQGTILASQLIALSAMRKGFYPVVGETFGAAQRGGPVMSHIKIARAQPLGPLIPYGKVQILLGFEPIEALRVGMQYLNSESSVIMNVYPIYPVDVLTGGQKYPAIDEVIGIMESIAKKFWKLNALDLAIRAGNPIAMNIVMVGALAGSGLTPLEPHDYKETIEEQMSRHGEVNLRAFELGLKEIRAK